MQRYKFTDQGALNQLGDYGVADCRGDARSGSSRRQSTVPSCHEQSLGCSLPSKSTQFSACLIHSCVELVRNVR